MKTGVFWAVFIAVLFFGIAIGLGISGVFTGEVTKSKTIECDLNYCYNSGDGDNIYEAGYIEFYKIDSESSECVLKTKYDYCSDENSVWEWKCERVGYSGELKNCLSGYACYEGACVDITTIPEEIE